MTATEARVGASSPWDRQHAGVTLGVFSLAFLFAFEALAVATVMPEVVRDLDGLSLYAVAFAAPLATSILALVVAGPAADRHGPVPVLNGGLVVFCAGVLVAGLAPSMPVFLLGRLLHGAGGGALGVALYVVIAEAYPRELRPRVFAILTSAWVLPAVVGPSIAAAVAAAVGWRWVFLGVPVLAVAAWWLVRSAGVQHDASDPVSPARRRVLLAALAAAGVLAVSAGGQRGFGGWPLLVAAGLVLVLAAGLRLLPRGAWSGARGVPSMLGTRGAVGASFTLAEVNLPLLLVLGRDLPLVAVGAVLTSGAVTWCLGAVLAARWSRLGDQVLRVRLGAVLVAAGIAGSTLAGVPAVPLVLPVLAWGVAGLGIGMTFSTISVLVLDAAAGGSYGVSSSALQLNDYLVTSTVLAVGSVVFAGFVGSAPVAGAVLLVGLAVGVALLASLTAARIRTT
ncbi:MAG: MFS transporter [Aeromicrobium sp.]|uniref:MFS transporter n=1 Tax=Aeromicrobium sp. TaxID=1871063 RepID=UPI00261F9B80|nr:MFS transporter [Aeromicrobium sp.]MDF1703908.1 MFS transporter [Aeromicrobium sp.]